MSDSEDKSFRIHRVVKTISVYEHMLDDEFYSSVKSEDISDVMWAVLDALSLDDNSYKASSIDKLLSFQNRLKNIRRSKKN